MSVSMLAFIVAVILGLLVAEARVSSTHEARLRTQGAIAPPGDVYRLLAVLYPAAFVLMGVEGAWRASELDVGSGAIGAGLGEPFRAAGVVMFAGAKALKYWAIHALGDRWTFRVLVVPGRPLVRTGPYRYVAHPNYIAVVGELVGTAMMVGARMIGPPMIAVFGAVLLARIRFENRVLRSMRSDA
jgi:methyltransferase